MVNKADLPLAERAERELLAMLSLRHYAAWTPKVMRTVATNGAGILELADTIELHARICGSQRHSHRGRVRRLIAASADDWVKRRIEGLDSAEFERLCTAVQCGETDYATADRRAVRLVLDELNKP